MQKRVDINAPWDIPFILELLQRAGKMGLDYWYKNDLQTDFKDDLSPVTEGDIAIEKLLASALDHPEQDIYLIGEETIEKHGEDYIQAALKAPVTYVVDPIDGTAPFANQLPMFGTAIGLMQYGKFTQGALFMPYFGDVYITTEQGVFYTQEHPRNTPLKFEQLKKLTPGKPRDGMIGLSQLMTKQGTYTGKERVQSICCSVYTFGNLIAGRYKGFISSGKIWDFAFAIALLKQLQGAIYTTHGKRINDEIEEYFDTDPDSASRWHVKDHLIMALNDATARYIADHTELD